LRTGGARSCASGRRFRPCSGRAGISTVSAEELLSRMLAKVDELASERDRLVGETRRKYAGTDKAILGPIERRFR
jgi:hypothetical protein